MKIQAEIDRLMASLPSSEVRVVKLKVRGAAKIKNLDGRRNRRSPWTAEHREKVRLKNLERKGENMKKEKVITKEEKVYARERRIKEREELRASISCPHCGTGLVWPDNHSYSRVMAFMLAYHFDNCVIR